VFRGQPIPEPGDVLIGQVNRQTVEAALDLLTVLDPTTGMVGTGLRVSMLSATWVGVAFSRKAISCSASALARFVGLS
jgi:hypothetical protein